MVIGATANHTVFDIQNTVEDVERAVIVRDDDDAGAALVGDLCKEFHDLPAKPAVERGGGFIGEDEAGLIGQGAGDGDALLLAAGEGVGKIVGTRADAEVVEQLQSTLACGLRSGVVDFQGDLHIFQRAEERNEIGLLKNKTEVLPAKRAQVHKRRGPSITGVPPMMIWPAVGGLISAIAVSSVDLPAPLGPSIATTSPRATCIETSRMATTSVWPLP